MLLVSLIFQMAVHKHSSIQSNCSVQSFSFIQTWTLWYLRYFVSWFLCSWLWCANTTKEISTCAYICVFHLYLCLCLYLYLCLCLYLFRMWSQSPAQNLRFPIRALSRFHLYISVSVFLLYISVLGHCSVSLYHLHTSVSAYHISMCISDIANPRRKLKKQLLSKSLEVDFLLSASSIHRRERNHWSNRAIGDQFPWPSEILDTVTVSLFLSLKWCWQNGFGLFWDVLVASKECLYIFSPYKFD